METYLIQQAHVGKLHFVNINIELHSLAWGMSAEWSRVVQSSVASAQLLKTEELRASGWGFAAYPVQLLYPHLKNKFRAQNSLTDSTV